MKAITKQAARNLEQKVIDSIKATEDGYTPAAGRYFAWIDKTSHGMIDGLEPYLKYLRKTFQSARTISTYLSAAKNRVRKLMPHLKAEQHGQLEALLKSLKPDKADRAVDVDKILTGAEIDKLVEGLRAGKVPGGPTLAFAVEFLQATGCRVSEMLDAQSADISHNGSVRLRVHGKGKKERKIPLAAGDLLERIRKHFKGATWLFEHNGRPYTRQFISQGITRAAQRILNRDGVSAHSLRHSVLTRMIERGIAVKAVSRYAGHSSTAITQDLYIHVDVVEEDLAGLWDDDE